MFRLKLLGPLSLHDEQGISPPGAQQKRRMGLLALVAAAGDRGLSRDQLQCFLWPESPSAQSRHALDQLVYATRRALGDDPFLSEGGTLRLDRTVVESDLGQFNQSLRAGRLDEAANLYSGPLLDGFHLGDSRELEGWIDSERAKAAEQFGKTIEKLAREARERDDHVAAGSWWQRLATTDPLSARVATEVIQALVASGDTVRAIRYARNFQHRVRSELEMEPDARIESLIASLAPARSVDFTRPKASARHATQPILSNDSDRATTDAPALSEIAAGGSHFPRITARSLAAVLMTAVLIISFAVFKGARGEKAPNPAFAADNSPTTRPAEARENYLKGVNAWNTRSKEGLDTAVVYFRRALEIDPSYAEAYGGLANAYVLLGYSSYRPADAMFPKAKAAALRAIQLDSTLSAPYAALGMELTGERNFKAAEAAYRTAIARDPRYATAHQWYGILLMILGRMPQAVEETRKAAELDPLSLQIQNTYATFLNAAGQHSAALQHYQKVAAEEPDSAWVRRNPLLLTNMAAVYKENRQFDKALHFANRAVEIEPRHPRTLLSLASVHIAMGRPELAREVFSRADTTNEQYVSYRALMYLAEGKADSAFLWFDRVKEWGIPILISLQTSRELRELKNDPRRQALLDKLGI